MWDQRVEFTRMQSSIFSFGGKMAEPLPNGRGFCHCGDRNSASSPEPRSLWRLGWSADQCVEVKVPVFLRCTGKPSSANVTSVLYARQRDPRTARLQLDHIAGL